MAKKSKSIKPIEIEAKDCSSFDEEDSEKKRSISEHLKSISEHLNDFTVVPICNAGNKNNDPLVTYDYSQRKWFAGRYVGEATFSTINGPCKLKITPRFGNVFLFRLFEVIFNIKLYDSHAKLISSNKTLPDIFKLLIPHIWLKKLSSANMHGLPRISREYYHKGFGIKGKIDIRQTIRSLYVTREVTSKYRQKEMDHIIVSILAKARNILEKNYNLGGSRISESTRDVLSHLDQYQDGSFRISHDDYANIRYGTIYQGYKDVVDFSWRIIRNKHLNQKHESDEKSKSFGLFIDMAELWEAYLRSLIARAFKSSGWDVSCTKEIIYEKKDFLTSLIPDIVMEKDGRIAVWDAKYKNMKFVKNNVYSDYDRSDFHQIHTYMYYYQQKFQKPVLAGGLLYPLSKEFSQEVQETNKSSLFGLEDSQSTFSVDGIDLSGLKIEDDTSIQIEYMQRKEAEFIQRLEKKIARISDNLTAEKKLEMVSV